MTIHYPINKSSIFVNSSIKRPELSIFYFTAYIRNGVVAIFRNGEYLPNAPENIVR